MLRRKHLFKSIEDLYLVQKEESSFVLFCWHIKNARICFTRQKASGEREREREKEKENEIISDMIHFQIQSTIEVLVFYVGLSTCEGRSKFVDG